MGILYYLYRRDFCKNMAQVYIKEVFIKYRVLNKIILDRDIRFILIFSQIFIVE